MKIKQITLKNWQKHSHLKLDFSEDLNVITGYSNMGKSCIRRAIEWSLFNANISENDYRKEGTKETSVTILLDSDCEIERIRSASINRYILRKDNEEKVFDNFGRAIPDEIQQIIQMKTIAIENESLNLNIAEQLTLPFLLDKSASFRAKLFNKLTGNELLDNLFKECNRESLRINRELRETEERVQKQEEELAKYSLCYKNLKNKLCSVKEQYEQLKEKVEIYEHLQQLAEKIKTNKESQDFVQFKISKIKTISEVKIIELKAKIEETKTLQNLFYELESVEENLQKLTKQQKQIKILDIDCNILKEKDKLHSNLQQICCNLTQIEKKQKDITIQTDELKSEISNSEKERKEIWDKCDICPLCKQKINNE